MDNIAGDLTKSENGKPWIYKSGEYKATAVFMTPIDWWDAIVPVRTWIDNNDPDAEGFYDKLHMFMFATVAASLGGFDVGDISGLGVVTHFDLESRTGVEGEGDLLFLFKNSNNGSSYGVKVEKIVNA